MSKNSVTFLGTGTSLGVPVITCNCVTCKSDNQKDKRLRASILVSIGEKNVVIDTGPDFRQQMLDNKVEMVDAVIFTHEHKDHISGMDDIRPFNFQSKKPMELFASLEVQEALKREYHYVFSNDYSYPGIPQVNVHTIGSDNIELFGQQFIPIDVLHHQLPVKAFRINNFTYITDANYISEDSYKKIMGTEILVINALRKEKHISHFTLDEALEIIDRIGPEKAYLTHISHLMGKHSDVSKELPEGVELAYDGLQIEIA